MKTVLCFGDSNTWGYSPVDAGRYPYEVRWPGVLAAELGSEHRVIEEGLNGRTTIFDDPMGDHWNGREYFIPCLDTHRPLDLVILMLGTNDLKHRFSLTPFDIAFSAGVLVDICQRSVAGPGGGPPPVLLISPAEVVETGPWAETFRGAQEKCTTLGERFSEVAEQYGCAFMDAAQIVTPSPLDGIHWDPAGHRALGKAVAQRVRRIVG